MKMTKSRARRMALFLALLEIGQARLRVAKSRRICGKPNAAGPDGAAAFPFFTDTVAKALCPKSAPGPVQDR